MGWPASANGRPVAISKKSVAVPKMSVPSLSWGGDSSCSGAMLGRLPAWWNRGKFRAWGSVGPIPRDDTKTRPVLDTSTVSAVM